MAGLTDPALELMGNYLKGLLKFASLHSGAPGTTGLNEVGSAGRKDLSSGVVWNVDADGDLTLSGTLAYTGMSAAQAVANIGFWGESAMVAISSANTGTDVITTSGNHGFSVNDPVVFAGSAPTGINIANTYFVNATPSGTTFSVAATRGGGNVDITATGTGSVGRWYGFYALSGDTTANSLGEYNVTAVTINGTAS